MSERAETGRDAVRAHGLTKVFHDPRQGEVRAAIDVSFECRYGEVFGLLGPNGAGKSTTLRMLSTVLRPTSGTATIAGHDILEAPLAVRGAIGFLSGSTGLYGRLTAKETLEYFGRLHGLAGERLAARVEELLDLFAIREYADARCERLSTGMKQKVSIARAIVHDPAVLILDEPTLGLDILVASTMLRFVRRCRERGKCVILSTHILSEVEELCDRVAMIHRGRLQAMGTLDELRAGTGETSLREVFFTVIGERPDDDAGPVRDVGAPPPGAGS